MFKKDMLADLFSTPASLSAPATGVAPTGDASAIKPDANSGGLLSDMFGGGSSSADEPASGPGFGTKLADMMALAGMALQGDPNFAQASEKVKAQRAAMENENATYKALTKRGLSPQDAKLLVKSPQALKMALPHLFGGGKSGGKTQLTEVGVADKPGWKQRAYVSPDGNVVPVGEPYQTGSGGGTGPQASQFKNIVNPETGETEVVAFDPVTATPRATVGKAPNREKDKVDLGYKISGGDLRKMTDEAQIAKQMTGFVDTFNDKYGGFGGGWSLAADAHLAAGRKGYTGPETQEAANWWQGYQKYKNTVRHELFGSALTATERDEFMKADIDPSMDPKAIKTNLGRQNTILQAAMKRRAGAYIASNYNKNGVLAAYGLSEDELSAPNEGSSKAQDRVSKAESAPQPTAGWDPEKGVYVGPETNGAAVAPKTLSKRPDANTPPGLYISGATGIPFWWDGSKPLKLGQ